MSSWFEILSNDPEVIAVTIPIVAILVGGIIAIVSMVIKHRERMRMIEHGIHPDYPPEEEPPAEQPSSGQNSSVAREHQPVTQAYERP